MHTTSNDMLFACVSFQPVTAEQPRPHLMSFVCPLQPAQSELDVVTSSPIPPKRKTCLSPLHFMLQASDSSFQPLQGSAAWGFDIGWHSWCTMNVMPARSWLRNKHLATLRSAVAGLCLGPMAPVHSLSRHALLESARSCHVRVRDLIF